MPCPARSDGELTDHEWQDKTFTLELKGHGEVAELHGPMRDVNGRADQMRELLRRVSKFLPDMNITFTGHDVPWVTMSGETRAKHMEAARDGRGAFSYEGDRLRKGR